jgi:inosine-uridine nucleoside N-ribohydrolase
MTIPVLAYTDDGRDVDDIEALVYLAGHSAVDLVGVVTTHMIPDRRAFIVRKILDHLGVHEVPIGVGSIFPIGKEDQQLVKYLREHTIDNITYEGHGLIECFPDGIDVIHESIAKYGSALKIAALAPLTDLAWAAERDEKHFCEIGGLYIQGQAIIENGRLVPDPAAYNLKEDLEAAYRIFSLQDRIPFTLVGKHTAYHIPLTRRDFAEFSATGNRVGAYLETHAIKGIECFARRDPEVFRRVFNIDPSSLSDLDELSKPYDALVAKAIANPTGLISLQFGHHRLIGMSATDSGIVISEQDSVKNDIICTILDALLSRKATSVEF